MLKSRLLFILFIVLPPFVFPALFVAWETRTGRYETHGRGVNGAFVAALVCMVAATVYFRLRRITEDQD